LVVMASLSNSLFSGVLALKWGSRTVSQALLSVNFKATALKDVGRRQMLSAVKAFAAQLARGGPDAVGFLAALAQGRYWHTAGVSRRPP
jgi:hypothetical protein